MPNCGDPVIRRFSVHIGVHMALKGLAVAEWTNRKPPSRYRKAMAMAGLEPAT